MATLDPHNLQRFIDAQHPIYGQVRDELQGGQKESHWMWFIFPQIKGLGTSMFFVGRAVRASCPRSTTAAQRRDSGPPPGFFGLLLRPQRAAWSNAGVSPNNPSLHPRSEGHSPAMEDIFGYPDHLKFHSCMTLFAHLDSSDKSFAAALTKYFDANGSTDSRTALTCEIENELK
jgi:uncharacterized protein (DUF1810 family)